MRRGTLWLCAGLTATATLVLVAATVLQVSLYRIGSGSMEPDFPVGTVVVVSGMPRLEPHRAITFTADGHTVTHVLVGYGKDGSLVTRGLANAVNDDWTTPVYPHDVKGTVLYKITVLAPLTSMLR